MILNTRRSAYLGVFTTLLQSSNTTQRQPHLPSGSAVRNCRNLAVPSTGGASGVLHLDSAFRRGTRFSRSAPDGAIPAAHNVGMRPGRALAPLTAGGASTRWPRRPFFLDSETTDDVGG